MSTDMTPVRELIDRVDGATGPDRVLDADIAAAFMFLSPEAAQHRYAREAKGPFVAVKERVQLWADGPSYAAPCVTGSTDAALALIEQVLPMFTTDLTVYRTNNGTFAPHSIARLFCPYGEIKEYRADAPTPALALVKALLKALDVQDGAVDGAGGE